MTLDEALGLFGLLVGGWTVVMVWRSSARPARGRER